MDQAYSEVSRMGEEDGPFALDPLMKMHRPMRGVSLEVRNDVSQAKNLCANDISRVSLAQE